MSSCEALTSRSTETYVVSDIGSRVVDDVVGHTRQSIPNTRTTTFVLRGAFDLESCTSDSPPGKLSNSEAPQCTLDIPEVFRERPRLVFWYQWYLLTGWERAVVDRWWRNQRARRNRRWLADRSGFGDFYWANEQVPHVFEIQGQLDHRSSGTWSCRAIESNRCRYGRVY